MISGMTRKWMPQMGSLLLTQRIAPSLVFTQIIFEINGIVQKKRQFIAHDVGTPFMASVGSCASNRAVVLVGGML